MGLTIPQVASMAGVSTGWVSMVETGQRHPGPDRLARLRDALGIVEALPGLYAADVPTEDLVARLGAILAAVPSIRLKVLSRALQVPVGTIRRGIGELSRQLAPAGMRVLDDGVEAQLSPAVELREVVSKAVQAQRGGTLTKVQTVVLAVVIAHGMATRRQVDEVRGADSSEALGRLVELGYLVYDADEEAVGHPRVYRPTSYLLQRFGVRTVEELQATLRESVAALPGVTEERLADLFGAAAIGDLDEDAVV